MKIALFNPFPAQSCSVERRFIQHCLEVLPALGHTAVQVCCSDEVIGADPDFVVVMHELVPKLTAHFTVGLLWNPTRHYDDERDRESAIRSWDLVVPVNEGCRRFAEDLHFPVRHRQAVSRLDFFPSAPAREMTLPGALSLACVATSAGDIRRQKLFEALAALVDLHGYGPPEAWAFLPGHYRGLLPEGPEAAAALNRHGVVLAAHEAAQVDEDTPGLAVCEAVAARCLLITDPLPSLMRLFGDSVCFVDMSRTPDVAAGEIAGILRRYQDDPAGYRAAVEAAGAVFSAGFTLQQQLAALVEEMRAHRRALEAAVALLADGPDITVILRCGGRPLAMVARAVASLAGQTYRNLGIVLARFAAVEGFAGWLDEVRQSGRFQFVDELLCADDGMRSHPMWAGLRVVRSPFFCLLDDDDEMFPQHLSGLVMALRANPAAAVAYTGTVRQEEDGVRLNRHPRFAGDLDVTVPERRQLEKFDDFDLERLLRGDCFIPSNAWLARREVLTAEVLDDPDLAVSEDWYFYLLLASRHRFLFAGSATVLWNWRSMAGDNSLNAVTRPVWDDCVQRVRKRLAHVAFPSLQIGTVVARRAVAADEAAPAAGAAGAVPGPCYAIDFAAARLPRFVARWGGLSGPEPFGRWSDAGELLLKFHQPLPAVFTLRLVAFAFGENCGRPIPVTVGAARAAVTLAGDEVADWVEVPFKNPDGADTIRFSIPHPESPATRWPGRSYDTRMLGIALTRLEIVEAAPVAEGAAIVASVPQAQRGFSIRRLAGLRRREG